MKEHAEIGCCPRDLMLGVVALGLGVCACAHDPAPPGSSLPGFTARLGQRCAALSNTRRPPKEGLDRVFVEVAPVNAADVREPLAEWLQAHPVVVDSVSGVLAKNHETVRLPRSRCEGERCASGMPSQLALTPQLPKEAGQPLRLALQIATGTNMQHEVAIETRDQESVAVAIATPGTALAHQLIITPYLVGGDEEMASLLQCRRQRSTDASQTTRPRSSPPRVDPTSSAIDRSTADAPSAASKPEPTVTSPTTRMPARQRTLGIVVFPGFETLDVYGPVEMWGNLPQIKVIIIARQAGEVVSAQGPRTVAEFGYADAPPLDLLLFPGGPGAPKLLDDPATLHFVRTRAQSAEIVMSVCNGASFLAAAGLLDGRPATTNKAYWKTLTARAPKVLWRAKARWVDDGKLVTSSGVSAGMDMSLHVIERLFGTQAAEELGLGSEYEWHRDATWDPFAERHGLDGN
jgi:putative intracellular protease/amidase